MNESYTEYCINVIKNISEKYNITEIFDYSDVNICHFDKNQSTKKQFVNLITETFLELVTLGTLYFAIRIILSWTLWILDIFNLKLMKGANFTIFNVTACKVIFESVTNGPNNMFLVIFSNKIYKFKGLKVNYMLFTLFSILIIMIDFYVVKEFDEDNKNHKLFNFLIKLLFYIYNRYPSVEYIPTEKNHITKFMALIVLFVSGVVNWGLLMQPLLQYFDIIPNTNVKQIQT